MSIKFEAELNTERFNKQIDSAKNQANVATQQIITGIRRTAQVGISMSQIFGNAIDQSYAMAIEAGLLTIELIAAQQAGTLGITSVFQAGAVISMITTIALLESGRADNAQQVQGAVSAFRLLSF